MKGSVSQRFTSGDRTWTGTPVWAPDSRRVLFTDFATEYQIKPIRGGDVERWTHGVKSRGGWPRQWSSDGKYIVFTQNDPSTLWDIWLLPLSGERKPLPYLVTRFAEGTPAVSPDSRWVAYVSDESGSSEIYVNSFPRPGTPVRISTTGGIQPVWRRDGRELFYIAADRRLMAASLQMQGGEVLVAERRALFDVGYLDTRDERPQYAVLGNGERFLMTAMAEQHANRDMTVVLNWPALLKD